MKQNLHFIVPDSKFELLSGAEVITTYRLKRIYFLY